MQILAALALAIVQAHLVQYLPSQVQTERSLAAVQLRQNLPLATLSLQLLVAALSKPDLLKHAHQELVHIVLNAAGRLDELALPRGRQLLALFERTPTNSITEPLASFYRRFIEFRATRYACNRFSSASSPRRNCGIF